MIINRYHEISLLKGVVMAIKLELGASSLEINDEGMTIYVARWHFTAKQWRRLVARLTQTHEQLHWLRLPFQTGEQAGARWKRIGLDGLSLLIYALLLHPKHKLVKLMQIIDWGEVDRRCAAAYENSERGARAYAPQLLFRMLLVMVLYGLRFESSLVDQIETQLAWRWFCGLGVLTPVPTAATLCYFRQRLGPAKFEELLVWLIQQCEQAGMIGFDEAYFDFTGVAASATPLTPYQRTVVLAKAIDAYLAGLALSSSRVDAEVTARLRQLILETAQTVMRETHASVAKLHPESLSRSLDMLNEQSANRAQEPRWWSPIRQTLQGWQQQEPAKMEAVKSLLRQLTEAPHNVDHHEAILTALSQHLQQVGHELKATIPHAWGDLSARVGTLSAGNQVCGYLAGYLVDSKCNVIVGLVSVAANTAQASQAKVVVEKVKRWLGRLPRRLGLDSAFDRDQVYLDLSAEPLELFITSRQHRTTKAVFGPDRFLINEGDELCCPAGQPMQLKYGPYKDGRSIYEGAGCVTCPLLSQCVPETQALRRFQVQLDSHRRWLQNRARSQSAEGCRVRHQRFAREGVFGHANTFHNGDRAPYRDGAMNAIADCLTVFALNLEKLAYQANAPAA